MRRRPVEPRSLFADLGVNQPGIVQPRAAQADSPTIPESFYRLRLALRRDPDHQAASEQLKKRCREFREDENANS